MKNILLFIIVGLFLSFNNSYSKDLYKWVDEDGKTHYTNKIGEVPTDVKVQKKKTKSQDKTSNNKSPIEFKQQVTSNQNIYDSNQSKRNKYISSISTIEALLRKEYKNMRFWSRECVDYSDINNLIFCDPHHNENFRKLNFRQIKSTAEKIIKLQQEKELLISLLENKNSDAFGNNNCLLFSVVDGDTIKCYIGENLTTVRLIGIDALETTNNFRTKEFSIESGISVEKLISLGKKSKNYLSSLLEKGDNLTLTYDETKKDKYDRTLAYVYHSNGTMINDLMISEGYAFAYIVSPNNKYEDKFKISEKKAQSLGKGYWSGN